MFKRNNKKSLWFRISDFIYPRIGIKRSIKYTGHRLGRMNASPYEIACGFAVGAGISFTPFLGLHFILSAIVAFILRGSIIASAIGTIIGNPLTFPFIWSIVYPTGAYMVGINDKTTNIGEMFTFTLEKVSEINSWHFLFLTEYQPAIDIWVEYVQMWVDLWNVIYVFFIGSLPWAVIIWAMFFAIIYPLVKKYKQHRNARFEK